MFFIPSILCTCSFSGATKHHLHPTFISLNPCFTHLSILTPTSKLNLGYQKFQSDTLKNLKRTWHTKQMNLLTYSERKFIRTHWNKLQGIKSTTIGQKGLKLTYSKATNRRGTVTHLSNNLLSIFGFLKIHSRLYFSHSITVPYWLFWLHCLFLS